MPLNVIISQSSPTLPLPSPRFGQHEAPAIRSRGGFVVSALRTRTGFPHGG
jgi:hypothetical protein